MAQMDFWHLIETTNTTLCQGWQNDDVIQSF
jgi:hypothetical protein